MDPNNNPTDPGQGAPVDPAVPTPPVVDGGVQPEGVPPVTPEPSVPGVPAPEPGVETPAPGGTPEPSWSPEPTTPPAPGAEPTAGWNPEPTTTPPVPGEAPAEPAAPTPGDSTGGTGTV